MTFRNKRPLSSRFSFLQSISDTIARKHFPFPKSNGADWNDQVSARTLSGGLRQDLRKKLRRDHTRFSTGSSHRRHVPELIPSFSTCSHTAGTFRSRSLLSPWGPYTVGTYQSQSLVSPHGPHAVGTYRSRSLISPCDPHAVSMYRSRSLISTRGTQPINRRSEHGS